ncbi:hypothetical protein AB0L99_12535 [Streptomyces sp. NPDC051954]|uniref:hypothetical protein n=1 Tax=Streptomyces sp. NPDC051954 TaxID=3155524 RepID=UPI003426BDF4
MAQRSVDAAEVGRDAVEVVASEPGPGLGHVEAPESAGAQDPPGAVGVGAAVARKERRVLRGVLRWVVVVAVFAGVGAGTAYGVLGVERTELPGLATESDGRWPYPEISRAPVPPGSLGPLETRNWAEAHYADLRALVLPAPEGAKEDKALRGEDGWLATKDFLAVFGEKEDRDEAGQLLTDNGLRHIAARGWTTEDGTRTGIYLLQFDTGTVADQVYRDFTHYDEPGFTARGTTDTDFDDAYPTAADIEGISRYVYDEVKPYGTEHVRQAYLRAGDVIAVVVQARKGTAAAVPFQQTVTLQGQLLG